MKLRRVFLFRLNVFLISLLLVINPLNISSFPGAKVNAQASSRPYVVFVNGYQDCCTWGRYTDGSPDPYMDIVVDSLPSDSEILFVPWDRFVDGAGQRSDTSNDAEFLYQAADYINNQLDRNRPLILIGHSFGGDSLLSLAPRINRSIEFLGVIDPTAAGGFREPITHREIPPNVKYFFNRWQRNALDNVDIFDAREQLGIGGGSARNVVPFDSRAVDGSISNCDAEICDQQEQSLARREDGSELRVSCEAHEVSCEGWRLPGCNLSGCWSGSNGTKAKRLFHNDMPLDAYLQRQMANQIRQVLASYIPPDALSAGVIYAVTSDYRLLWYKHYGSQDGSVSWSSSREIGQGWNYRQVFSGGEGVIYAVTHDNKLLWYKHNGWQDGSVSWSGPREVVSRGWNYRDTFSGGNGIIYGVTSDNKLFWYKHNGWQDGSVSWSSPREVVSRAWNYRETFSGGDGIIYGVTPDNKLFWYRHNGWQDGSVSWSSPREVVSRAWNYRDTFSGGDGIIYGVTPDNKLFWYRHNGWQDGSVSWSSPREVVSRAWDFLQSF